MTKRQPKGIPTGGQFAESAHDEAASPLDGDYASRRWETDRPLYEKLRDTPTTDDFHRTRDAIIGEISMESAPGGEHTWENVVGKRARRTEKNVAKYEDHLTLVASNDPHYRPRHVEMAKAHAQVNSYARAYEQGIAIDPESEAYFESIWNDPEDNHGEVATRRRKDEITEMKKGISSGHIKPSAVIGRPGYGDPKRQAEEYLEREMQKVNRALATRGRSHIALASNALRRERSRSRDQSTIDRSWMG